MTLSLPLRRPAVRVATVVLLVQAALLYTVSRAEDTPQIPALKVFPSRLGAWDVDFDGSLEAEAKAVLNPDDYLFRGYSNGELRQNATVFIGYFKTQRTDKAPHSPKNCLPGAGWLPSTREVIDLGPPGGRPFSVNRYTIAKGDEKAVVEYWYESPVRSIASEYLARIYLVLDSIRYNRTDTALVRILVPVGDRGEIFARDAATNLVREVHSNLQTWFPAPGTTPPMFMSTGL